jgi:hypothetical protein
LQKFAAQLETWVGIDLDQPNIILGIDHEVQPKYFKVMLSISGIHLKIRCFDGIESYLFHPRIYLIAKAEFPLSHSGVHVSLELIVADFVSFFVFSIPLTILLNGVICQVNHFIPDIFDIVLIRAGSDVTLAKPIGPHKPMKSTDHHIVSDVKLSTFVEQWFLYVLLDNVSLLLTV